MKPIPIAPSETVLTSRTGGWLLALGFPEAVYYEYRFAAVTPAFAFKANPWRAS